ncbi:MAG: hypothetical protein ACXACT_16115 [Candidatus Thorarchaeota archaeon]|jgi:hypothetical protein
MLTWAEQKGKVISQLTKPDVPIYLISEGPNHVAAQIGMMKFNEFSILKGIAAIREDFSHHYNLAIKENDGGNMIALQMASYHTVLKFDPDKESFKQSHAEAFKIY